MSVIPIELRSSFLDDWNVLLCGGHLLNKILQVSDGCSGNF